jgi:hypothetical protein
MPARPVTACLLLLICTAPPLYAQQGETNSYRRLVDDYRLYGAAAVPRAAALTDDEIASGRHEIAGSWMEQRAAAMLHTEAMLSLANDGQLSAASRHLEGSRYLITYTPRGVDARGWHPLEVKLKGRRGNVTARRGYLR